MLGSTTVAVMAEFAWAEWQEALLDLQAAVDANEDSAMRSFREGCHEHTKEIADFALRATPSNSTARASSK